MNFLEDKDKEYISNAINKIKDTKEKPLEDIRYLYKEFFGNKFDLQETGLNLKFTQLKARVKEDKLIGLVLYSLNQDIDNDYNFINDYVNPVRRVVKLTITSISKFLITDHILIENLEDFCKDLD